LSVNCAGIAPEKPVVGRDGPTQFADFLPAITVKLVETFHVLAGTASSSRPEAAGWSNVHLLGLAAIEG
jgi:hypothetical protein